jgi:hypothetical protein
LRERLGQKRIAGAAPERSVKLQIVAIKRIGIPPARGLLEVGGGFL